MKEYKNIITKVSNSGISRITINDPKSYNALSLNTLKSLIEIFKNLENFNNSKKFSGSRKLV